MGLVAALNAINSQVWAFLILALGLGAALAFHKAGIAIDIAAGVVGAAVNMFNSLIKPAAPGSSHLEVDSSTSPPAHPSTISINPAPLAQAVEPPQPK
jgi:hypothetical protein